jgi:hypothetical protein
MFYIRYRIGRQNVKGKALETTRGPVVYRPAAVRRKNGVGQCPAKGLNQRRPTSGWRSWRQCTGAIVLFKQSPGSPFTIPNQLFIQEKVGAVNLIYA